MAMKQSHQIGMVAGGFPYLMASLIWPYDYLVDPCIFYSDPSISYTYTSREKVLVDQYQSLIWTLTSQFQHMSPMEIWKHYYWFHQGLSEWLVLAGNVSKDPERKETPIILCKTTCLGLCSTTCLAECLCLAGVKLTKLFMEDLESHICSCRSQVESWVLMGIHIQSEKRVKKRRRLFLCWHSVSLSGGLHLGNLFQ